MHTGFLKIAAFLGALTVALGAFAAHTLKEKLSESVMTIFDTAVKYQFYHTLALLAIAMIYKEFPNSYIRWSGILFIAGIILFSGSLYALTYVKGSELSGFKWIGPITPLGGLCFIVGWVLIFVGVSVTRS